MWGIAAVVLAAVVAAQGNTTNSSAVDPNTISPFTYWRPFDVPILNSMTIASPTTLDQLGGTDMLRSDQPGRYYFSNASAGYVTVSGGPGTSIEKGNFVFKAFCPGNDLYLRGTVENVEDGQFIGIAYTWENSKNHSLATETPVYFQKEWLSRGHALELPSTYRGATTLAVAANFTGTMNITHLGFTANVTTQVPLNETLPVSQKVNFCEGNNVPRNGYLQYDPDLWSIQNIRLMGNGGNDTLQTLPFFRGAVGSNKTRTPSLHINVPPNSTAFRLNGDTFPGNIRVWLETAGTEDTLLYIFTTVDTDDTAGSTISGDGVVVMSSLDSTKKHNIRIESPTELRLSSVEFYSFYKPSSIDDWTLPIRSATASNPSATNAATSSNSRPGSNVGAIAGGVVGGIVGLALLLALLFFCKRRSRYSDEFVGEQIRDTSIESVIPPPAPASSEKTAPRPLPAVPFVKRINTQSFSQGSELGTDSSDVTMYSPLSARPIASNDLVSLKTSLITAYSASSGSDSQPASATTSTSRPRTRQLPPQPEHVVTFEEDAGYLTPHHILPPNYNPRWEQERQERERELSAHPTLESEGGSSPTSNTGPYHAM